MKILTFLRDFRGYALRSDPGFLCLAGALRATLPSMIGVFVWVYFKPPNPDILLLMTPGFLGILSEIDHDWNGKIKMIFAGFLMIGIGQFGISVLSQTKFLILIWIFLVIFLSFSIPGRRQAAAYAAAMCIMSLSFNDQGWQAGTNRMVELLIGFIAVLISLFFISITLSRIQMLSVLSNYLSEIRLYFVSVTEIPDTGLFFRRKPDEILRSVSAVSLKANNIIKKEEYFSPKNISSAEKASGILNYLHSLGRDALFQVNFKEQRAVVEKHIPLTFPVCENIERRLSELLKHLKKGTAPATTDYSGLYEKWRKQYQAVKNGEHASTSIAEIIYGLECFIEDICELEKHLQNKEANL